MSIASCQSVVHDSFNHIEATSLLGEPLIPAPPSEALLSRSQIHFDNFEQEPTADNLIWAARFKAYQGRYAEAIQMYGEGIEKYPEDARMLRHRGHRYISIRKLDEAIRDFQAATQLIEGKPNEVEPDGMPNAQNIPVSTLHGNIWYHLGLAHFLQHQFEDAHTAYQACLATASSPDNVVSSTHWLYSIARRLGLEEEAAAYLEAVTPDMHVIENHAYHRLCLFYKGLMDEEALLATENDASASDAILYGLANWHLCEGNEARAREIYNQLLAGDSWASFGYIAAESDIAKLFNE